MTYNVLGFRASPVQVKSSIARLLKNNSGEDLVTLWLNWLTRKIIPEPTARSAVRRGLLIPLGYLHPGKCEHSEVQSHRFCHGRFSSLCACASHHRFQKYGGLHEERTLAEGFRKGENEDKNDCHKTIRDT